MTFLLWLVLWWLSWPACRWRQGGAPHNTALGAVFPGAALWLHRAAEPRTGLHQYGHRQHTHADWALSGQGQDLQGWYMFQIQKERTASLKGGVPNGDWDVVLCSTQGTSRRRLAGWTKLRPWTPLTASSTPSVLSTCWRRAWSRRRRTCAPSSPGWVCVETSRPAFEGQRYLKTFCSSVVRYRRARLRWRTWTRCSACGSKRSALLPTNPWTSLERRSRSAMRSRG